MALLTESELEVRLNHTNNAAKGRTNGARNLPDSLREIIGIQAHFDTAKNVGAAFGVAPITAHHAKESHGHESVRAKIDEKLGKSKDLALTKMLVAMNAIDDEKVKELSIKGKLAVAKTMSEIYDKTVEKIPISVPNQVVIYAPQVREANYDKVVTIERVS